MTPHLLLRDVVEDDLPLFFEFQMDPDANALAASTAKDPANREESGEGDEAPEGVLAVAAGFPFRPHVAPLGCGAWRGAARRRRQSGKPASFAVSFDKPGQPHECEQIGHHEAHLFGDLS